MKRNFCAFLILLTAVFFAPRSFALDSLEVFILRVQFAEEKPDNSLTTGKGVFGSVPMNKNAYSLDPPNQGGKASYWQKHMKFANEYYKAASGGKLAISTRVFPIYTLKKQIIDYNRTTKMDGEKTAEFDDARSRDYMTFVYDAVVAASADKSEDSPFKIPLSKNPNVKRAYMIVHAGASRLVDGGSMGTNGADTPADFMDVYVSRDAWEYLMPDSARSAAVKPAFGVNDNGDSVVNGLIIPGSPIDTLRTVMVVSETASQDGMNWGVNGIIVNQIGRELGLPNTYDWTKGISRLGYYDVMDFAGYNAGNGFLPSMPAAWDRAYMGWSRVKEVRPTAGHPVTVDIAAAGSGLGTEIVKVPLNGSEYLLIENRQRSWSKDSVIDVYLESSDEDSELDKKTVPVNQLNLVFEDSVCTTEKCVVNKKKAKGLIVKLSSYDAGLPSSGIAVWKVNDWYLRQTLQYGVANFWAGDTFRDHQFGLSLVEADGVLTIGKTFKNALGEDSYDYGSGSDLLPHLRDKSKDTVKTINPTGYANTATTMGGYTGIKITVKVPKNARKEKTFDAFMGDSVVNFAAPIISVTVSIDDGSIDGSKFPREIGLNTAVRGAVFLKNPEKEDEQIVVIGSEDGNLQAFSSLGDTLFASDTVVQREDVSVQNSAVNVPLYRVGPSYGSLVGLAGDGNSAYSLHKNAIVRTWFDAGMLPMQNFKLLDSATAGPIVMDGKIRYAEGAKLVERSLDLSAIQNGEKEMPVDFKIYDMAYCGELEDGFYVFGNNQGEVFLGDSLKGKDELKNGFRVKVFDSKEFVRLACTDLDRDGSYEVVAVGSRGSVAAVRKGKHGPEVVWKKSYKRGAGNLKDETSGIAIGDVDGDNYPEVVFLGENLVYALDRFGIPLEGFPVMITRGTPVVGFFSDPLIVDVTGDEFPEILVPSSEGLIYAYTGKGKPVTGQFPLAAGSYEDEEFYRPMSIFVMNAVSDKKSKGPELYAFHRNYANAYRLNNASSGAEKASAAWALPAGGNERTGFFNSANLGKAKKVEAKDEITEFFMYPNPVRGGVAKARFEIGAAAKSASLEIYDITGLCVFKQRIENVNAGRNEFEKLDLKSLGSDVYSVRLNVKFVDGKTKHKLYRIGVIR